MSLRYDGRLVSYDSTAAIGTVRATTTNLETVVYGADLTAASISLTPNADKFLFALGGYRGTTHAVELQKYT
jgi:hypothetical protein